MMTETKVFLLTFMNIVGLAIVVALYVSTVDKIIFEVIGGSILLCTITSLVVLGRHIFNSKVLHDLSAKRPRRFR